jgi:ribosome-binding factor A
MRHALARVLMRGEVRHPDLADVSITVSEVRVSPDLRNATAFVTPLGGGDATVIVAALRRAAPWLRGQIGRELRLRFTPGLEFAADASFDRATAIGRALEHPAVARDIADADEGEAGQ